MVDFNNMEHNGLIKKLQRDILSLTDVPLKDIQAIMYKAAEQIIEDQKTIRQLKDTIKNINIVKNANQKQLKDLNEIINKINEGENNGQQSID